MSLTNCVHHRTHPIAMHHSLVWRLLCPRLHELWTQTTPPIDSFSTSHWPRKAAKNQLPLTPRPSGRGYKAWKHILLDLRTASSLLLTNSWMDISYPRDEFAFSQSTSFWLLHFLCICTFTVAFSVDILNSVYFPFCTTYMIMPCVVWSTWIE